MKYALGALVAIRKRFTSMNRRKNPEFNYTAGLRMPDA